MGSEVSRSLEVGQEPITHFTKQSQFDDSSTLKPTSKPAPFNLLTKRYIIDGYCKAIKKTLSHQIPIEIMDIIVLFYHYMTFDKEHHGDCLTFENDNIVRKYKWINNQKRSQRIGNYKLKKRGNLWDTCLFGEEINGDDYNQFQLKIRHNKQSYFFVMGYIDFTKRFEVNYNQMIGWRENKQYGVGIFVSKHSFCLYDKDNGDDAGNGTTLKYKSATPMGANDTFILLFNFKLNELVISHNDIEVETLSLNDSKQIIPAFSFYGTGEEIEIIDYQYEPVLSTNVYSMN